MIFLKEKKTSIKQIYGVFQDLGRLVSFENIKGVIASNCKQKSHT